MIYRICYYFANIIIRIFYRRIYCTGLNDIPKDKPLLIVSNHPNGFLEPIIMACLFPIDLHFLVRGDLFEKKSLRWLLLATNQIPIYRFKDGIAALRNNQKTISKAIEVLNQNKAVIIFAEGSTDGNWFVRPLKKGMARMAFQCIDGKPNLNLHILPVGVTFVKSEHPGTEVFLNAGKVFPVSDFYVDDPKISKDKMDELSLYTEARIRELTIHLEDREDEDRLRKKWISYNLSTDSSFMPRVVHNSNMFEKFQLMAYNSVDDRIKYSQALNWWPFLLLPLAIPGFIFWFLPVYLGNLITRKYVKHREFISSVRASASAGLGLIYSILFVIFGAVYLGITNTLLIYILIWLSGLITLFIWETYNNDKRFS